MLSEETKWLIISIALLVVYCVLVSLIQVGVMIFYYSEHFYGRIFSLLADPGLPLFKRPVTKPNFKFQKNFVTSWIFYFNGITFLFTLLR